MSIACLSLYDRVSEVQRVLVFFTLLPGIVYAGCIYHSVEFVAPGDNKYRPPTRTQLEKVLQKWTAVSHSAVM